MDVIAGKSLQVSDAIISCQLDGKGGLIPIDDSDVLTCDKPCWLEPRGELALIRKQLIIMRRYMAPQRDVFSRIASERLPWMSDDDRRRMQDISDRLGRGLDDLDASVARTGVLADEISTVMAEAMNRRTYTMSLLAMVFLPTTFLTGLFGVNLGGIPGGEWHYGFSTFCLLLTLLVIGVAWWLRKRKWL
ncbi:zinc transporter ZntB [Erwinia sp. MYb535]|uniref:zinc transporter ZntB n=1 Tax=Erwinia sp. MYb535 TaxID=2745309 RepID=UPI00309570DF